MSLVIAQPFKWQLLIEDVDPHLFQMNTDGVFYDLWQISRRWIPPLFEPHLIPHFLEPPDPLGGGQLGGVREMPYFCLLSTKMATYRRKDFFALAGGSIIGESNGGGLGC